MSGNSFGSIFKISTFGESHGLAIGVTVDGCPAGLTIDKSFIQSELDRRRPGQSRVTTERNEADHVEIISGIFEGKSTGAPIAMIIKNKDQRSKDYSKLKDVFRPSHADYTYQRKYGIRDHKGGGRSSARETAARVAAGAIAKTFLNKFNIKFSAYVSAVGNIKLSKPYTILDLSTTENNIVRCPDNEVAEQMIALIVAAMTGGNATLDMEATPDAVNITFTIELEKQ